MADKEINSEWILEKARLEAQKAETKDKNKEVDKSDETASASTSETTNVDNAKKAPVIGKAADTDGENNIGKGTGTLTLKKGTLGKGGGSSSTKTLTLKKGTLGKGK